MCTDGDRGQPTLPIRVWAGYVAYHVGMTLFNPSMLWQNQLLYRPNAAIILTNLLRK